MSARVGFYDASTLRSERAAVSAIAKRLFDIVASFVILLLILPVFLMVMGAVACGDHGPLFFGQYRVGRDGRLFKCLKFRTMYVGADRVLEQLLERDAMLREEWRTTGKLREDPRISTVGGFLRSTSLDELPQIWNVIRGDMSLVGPRPITEEELSGPYMTFGGHADYLRVRPGITGLWQVSGRSSVGYRKRVALDVDYVRNASLAGDVRILLRTVRVVLLRTGAC